MARASTIGSLAAGLLLTDQVALSRSPLILDDKVAGTKWSWAATCYAETLIRYFPNGLLDSTQTRLGFRLFFYRRISE